jgi:hypothetical protein
MRSIQKLWHRSRRQAFARALNECRWTGNITVTSYPSFPVDDFVGEGVSASVQVYDRFDSQPLSFGRTWVNRWGLKGFQSVRAGVGIYRLTKVDGEVKGLPKPLPRQRAYLDSMPVGVDVDVWTLRSQQLNFRQHAAHYAELRRFATG